LYADESCQSSCLISDAPDPALEKYFSNIDTVIENITEKLEEYENQSSSPETSEKVGVSRSLSKTRANIMASMNKILSFREHY